MSRYDSGDAYVHTGIFVGENIGPTKRIRRHVKIKRPYKKTVAVIDWVPAVQQNLHLCYQRTVAAVAARDVTI